MNIRRNKVDMKYYVQQASGCDFTM